MTFSAHTVLQQLGGNKFCAMTGAKDFIAGINELRFNLPRGAAKNKATKVIIKLNANDLYDVTFCKWNSRKLDVEFISQSDDIDADSLQSVFTRHTGLETRL